MSEIMTDLEVASLDHALQSVAVPQNFRMMVDRLFESHFALTEKVANPLQAAALAALVAWREVGLAFDRTNFDSWPDWHERWDAAEDALRTTADALIAAEGGTG